MKKITITAGLALALTVGLGTTAKSAWAGYLSAPTLSTTNNLGSGSFGFTVNSATDNAYAINNGSYGATLPTIPAIDSLLGITPGTNISITDPNSPTTFSPSGLNLTPVTSLDSPYSMGSGLVTGNIITNVFAVGANPTMAGAVQGELVFTYQFDVTGSISPGNTGITGASVGFFDNPGFSSPFELATGINFGSSLGSPMLGANFSGSTYVNASGQVVALTPSNIVVADLTGLAQGTSLNTYSTLGYNAATDSSVTLGTYSPQFFVATNAFYTSMGTIGFSGSSSSGGGTVLVPGTPEPKTLILFGSGIALLAFMFLRKQENTLSI
jgi:hypothetical protein